MTLNIPTTMRVAEFDRVIITYKAVVLSAVTSSVNMTGAGLSVKCHNTINYTWKRLHGLLVVTGVPLLDHQIWPATK